MPPLSAMASVASYEPQKGYPREGNEIERRRYPVCFKLNRPGTQARLSTDERAVAGNLRAEAVRISAGPPRPCSPVLFATPPGEWPLFAQRRPKPRCRVDRVVLTKPVPKPSPQFLKWSARSNSGKLDQKAILSLFDTNSGQVWRSCGPGDGPPLVSSTPATSTSRGPREGRRPSHACSPKIELVDNQKLGIVVASSDWSQTPPSKGGGNSPVSGHAVLFSQSRAYRGRRTDA